MGNILAGMDLIRRKNEAAKPAYGLVFPLLTTSDGVKMGKSVDGAVWLEPSRPSFTSFRPLVVCPLKPIPTLLQQDINLSHNLGCKTSQQGINKELGVWPSC